jgi:hypothetical protein
LTERLAKRYLHSRLQTQEGDWTFEECTSEGQSVTSAPEIIRLERPLRCLVIPGDDLLDVRCMWDDLQGLECFIKYLGFNESHGSEQIGTRLHVAHNEVTALSRMSRDSIVLPDRFQSIANRQSKAYQYLLQYGPYDVVNLDLCDSLFPGTAKDPTEYYNAIHRLAEYQGQNQTTPWLLFLTTQVEPGTPDIPKLENLCGPTIANCAKHADFARRFGGLVPTQAFEPGGVEIDVTALTGEQLIQVFGLALGKYLLELASSGNPGWFVQMLSSYRYKIKVEPQVEMLSLAFLFRRRNSPPVDQTGMSVLPQAASTAPTEFECAMKLITSVENLRDLDALLTQNAALRSEIVNSSADLLELAGFDRAKYLDWVQDGEP